MELLISVDFNGNLTMLSDYVWECLMGKALMQFKINEGVNLLSFELPRTWVFQLLALLVKMS